MTTVDWIKSVWQEVVRFLTEYDLNKIMDILSGVDRQEVLLSPFTWLVSVPLLVYLIVRRHYRILLVGISAAVFVFFLQTRFPPAGETIPLSKLLEFLGVAIGIIGVNVYLLFIRDK